MKLELNIISLNLLSFSKSLAAFMCSLVSRRLLSLSICLWWPSVEAITATDVRAHTKVGTAAKKLTGIGVLYAAVPNMKAKAARLMAD